jgi:uncharacterized peroxidase-related enzyme
MTRFAPLTPDTAQGKAKDLLQDLVDRHGEVGPMVRLMASSPAVLGGYLELSRAMKRAKLDRRSSERISLAVQERVGCRTCLAAHTEAARGVGLTEEEIALARRGTAGEPAAAAIVAFGVKVLTEPAGISDADIQRLRELGFTDREITDVVGVVVLNLLTGAFNLVSGNEPEEAAEERAAA